MILGFTQQEIDNAARLHKAGGLANDMTLRAAIAKATQP